MNDIIADGLTRIRNALLRKLDHTILLHAKIVVSIMTVLKEQGYIKDYKVINQKHKKVIKVILKYDNNGKPLINELKRISKCSRRVYKSSQDIKRFKSGYGILIVSTSKGVISNELSHQYNVGGEILCSVW